MTLIDLPVSLPTATASLFKWHFSYSYAAVNNRPISTDLDRRAVPLP